MGGWVGGVGVGGGGGEGEGGEEKGKRQGVGSLAAVGANHFETFKKSVH